MNNYDGALWVFLEDFLGAIIWGEGEEPEKAAAGNEGSIVLNYAVFSKLFEDTAL